MTFAGGGPGGHNPAHDRGDEATCRTDTPKEVLVTLETLLIVGNPFPICVIILFTPKVGNLCISYGRLPADDCKVLIITLSGKDNFLTNGKKVY